MERKSHKINNTLWLVVWLMTTLLSISALWYVTPVSVVISVVAYTVMELALWYTIHNAIDEFNDFNN